MADKIPKFAAYRAAVPTVHFEYSRGILIEVFEFPKDYHLIFSFDSQRKIGPT